MRGADKRHPPGGAHHDWEVRLFRLLGTDKRHPPGQRHCDRGAGVWQLHGTDGHHRGVGFAERVGDVEDVGLESDDHRLVRQPEPLHLIGRRTHDDRLAAPHLVIADPAAVGFKHPHGVLLARIEVGKA